MMDAATRIDVREQELDAMIARRHDKRIKEEGENSEASIAEIWAESARKYNVARRQALWWDWLEYHERMLRNCEHTLRLISAHHRQEAARYRQLLGIDEEVA